MHHQIIVRLPFFMSILWRHQGSTNGFACFRTVLLRFSCGGRWFVMAGFDAINDVHYSHSSFWTEPATLVDLLVMVIGSESLYWAIGSNVVHSS